MSSPKILVAGPPHSAVDALAHHLESHNCLILIAFDGAQVVALARTERPDLIVMDVKTRDSHGWDAAALLKTTPDTSHIPVIVLDGHTAPNGRLIEKIETLLPLDRVRKSSGSASGI